MLKFNGSKDAHVGRGGSDQIQQVYLSPLTWKHKNSFFSGYGVMGSREQT